MDSARNWLFRPLHAALERIPTARTRRARRVLIPATAAFAQLLAQSVLNSALHLFTKLSPKRRFLTNWVTFSADRRRAPGQQQGGLQHIRTISYCH
jgi:hypothetical protein